MRRAMIPWLLIVGCDEPKPETGECQLEVLLEGQELMVDETEDCFGCAIDIPLVGACEDVFTIKGVRISGSGESPEKVGVRNPQDCTGAMAGNFETLYPASSSSGWEVGAANHAFCTYGEDVGSSLDCNSIDQAQSEPWRLYLPPHPEGCGAYGQLEFEFLYEDSEACLSGETTPGS